MTGESTSLHRTESECCHDSGWVPDNGIAPFTVDSMVDKFTIKKLKDKDYRAAFIEAVRIVTASGEVFPDGILEAIRQYDKVGI